MSLRQLRKCGIREGFPPLGSGRTRGQASAGRVISSLMVHVEAYLSPPCRRVLSYCCLRFVVLILFENLD